MEAGEESTRGPKYPFNVSLSPVWDTSQERAYMENLLNQRVGFFLVFFALVVAGAVNAKTRELQLAILASGLLIAALLYLPICRASAKVDLLVKALLACRSHPAKLADDQANELEGIGRFSRVTWSALSPGHV